MTRKEARKILTMWMVSSRGADGQRGYIEGWFDKEDVEAFRMAIEALSAEADWIPVSERLPIPTTFCLVTTDGSHGDVIDIALYMSDGWHKASEVLAWMPLPEPYREGER